MFKVGVTFLTYFVRSTLWCLCLIGMTFESEYKCFWVIFQNLTVTNLSIKKFHNIVEDIKRIKQNWILKFFSNIFLITFSYSDNTNGYIFNINDIFLCVHTLFLLIKGYWPRVHRRMPNIKNLQINSFVIHNLIRPN